LGTASEAKVADLEIAIGVQEKVGWLEVTVNNWAVRW
jgi:hypothetical protein